MKFSFCSVVAFSKHYGSFFINSSTQCIIVEIAFQYLTIFADDIGKLGSIPFAKGPEKYLFSYVS